MHLLHVMSHQSDTRPHIGPETRRRVWMFASPLPVPHHRVLGRGHRLVRAGGGPTVAVPGDHRRGHRRGRPGTTHRPRAARGGSRPRPGRSLVLRTVGLGNGRRGPHLRPPRGPVRPRATTPGLVLHTHPDRRSREPPQQRRDRRPAGTHRDARHGGRKHHHGADHPRHPLPAGVAHNPAGHGPAATVHPPGPPGGQDRRRDHPRGHEPERHDERHDDRTVQCLRSLAGQALRAAGRGAGRLRRQRRTGPRHRHPKRPLQPHLRDRPHAAGRHRHRRRLLGGRLAGDQRHHHHRHPGLHGCPRRPALRAAGPAHQRTGGRHVRIRVLRARLRGARCPQPGCRRPRRRGPAPRPGAPGAEGGVVPVSGGQRDLGRLPGDRHGARRARSHRAPRPGPGGGPRP